MARAQLRIIIVASLAGLLFGFDTAVVAGTTHALSDVFHLSPVGLGLAISAALWGTLLGALAFGNPGDLFGSRTALRCIAVLYMVAAVGSACAWNFESFVVSRFMIGVAIGGSSVLAPVYIAEVSPAERRGSLVGSFQVNIVIGILLAYTSNFAIAQFVAGASAWRWKFAAAVLPAAVFLVSLLFIPQSPRWLISKGRKAEAAQGLAQLGAVDPGAAIAEIESAQLRAGGAPSPQLSWQRHRRPIVLAMGLAIFNQLSGINAILYYLGDIFGAAGFSSVSADVQSIAIGLTNLIATLVAMTLIDRSGRKRLLLVGSVIMAAAQFGVAAIMATGSQRGLLLPLLIVFIASFALSQGAVIWVYLSEIFPTTVRARGQSVGSATHWVVNALISAGFPAIAAVSKSVPFLFFGVMMTLQFFLVLRYLPETKGVALEEMGGIMEQAFTPRRQSRI